MEKGVVPMWGLNLQSRFYVTEKLFMKSKGAEIAYYYYVRVAIHQKKYTLNTPLLKVF